MTFDKLTAFDVLKAASTFETDAVRSTPQLGGSRDSDLWSPQGPITDNTGFKHFFFELLLQENKSNCRSECIQYPTTDSYHGGKGMYINAHFYDSDKFF